MPNAGVPRLNSVDAVSDECDLNRPTRRTVMDEGFHLEIGCAGAPRCVVRLYWVGGVAARSCVRVPRAPASINRADLAAPDRDVRTTGTLERIHVHSVQQNVARAGRIASVAKGWNVEPEATTTESDARCSRVEREHGSREGHVAVSSTGERHRLRFRAVNPGRPSPLVGHRVLAGCDEDRVTAMRHRESAVEGCAWSVRIVARAVAVGAIRGQPDTVRRGLAWERVGTGVEYDAPASSIAATARPENTGNRRAAANTITRPTLTMDRLKALPEISDPFPIAAIPQLCL